MSSDLVVVGGGGHAKTCLDIMANQDSYRVVGIVSISEDDNSTKLPWLGDDAAIPELAKSIKNFFIAIGQITTPGPREKVGQLLERLNLHAPSFISQSSIVSPSAVIGEGTIILPNSFVGADVKIGKHSIVGSGAIIEHDTIVEAYCHIATGAIVNGECNIGSGSFVGAGAVLRNQINVVSHSFVRMGAIVTRDEGF